MKTNSRAMVIGANILVLTVGYMANALAQPGGATTTEAIAGTHCVMTTCGDCNFVVNGDEGINDFTCCSTVVEFRGCQWSPNEMDSCPIDTKTVYCQGCRLYTAQEANAPNSPCRTICPGGDLSLNVNKCINL